LRCALLAWLVTLGPAIAQEGPAQAPGASYTGQTVLRVETTFERPTAQRVGDLRYLVGHLEGRPFLPSEVSATVEDLYRLGIFRQVEAWVEASGPEGVVLQLRLDPRDRISGFRFRGNRGLGRAVLEAALGKAVGDSFSPTDTRRLSRQLQEFYVSQGFLDAQVRSRAGRRQRRGPSASPGQPEGAVRGRVQREASDRVVLVFDIDEGPRTRVAAIAFSGAPGYPDQRLARKMKTRRGGPLRTDVLVDDLRALREFYRREGFPAAQIPLPTLPYEDERADGELTGRKLLGVAVEEGEVQVLALVSKDRKEAELRISVDPGTRVEIDVQVQWRKRWPRLSRTVWETPRPEPGDGALTPAPPKLRTTPLGEAIRRETGLIDAPFLHPLMLVDAADRMVEVLRRRRHRMHATATIAEQELAPGRFRASFVLDAGPRVRLKRLRRRDVVGLEEISLVSVRQVLTEASPLVQRGVYDPEDLQGAGQALQRWMRAQGYRDATVQMGEPDFGQPDELGRPRRVRVPMVVQEGERRDVSSVIIHGSLLDDEQLLSKLEDSLLFRAFNEVQVRRVARELEDLHRTLGHLDVRVRTEERISDDGKRVSLELFVVPGPEVRLGSVLIVGNRHTRTGLIQNELRLRPGQRWRPNALEAARRRLVDLGLFRAVRLEPVQTEGRVRDLRLTLRERPRVRLRLGGSIDSDRGMRLLADLRLLNPFGIGQRLSIRGQVGFLWDAFQAPAGASLFGSPETAPDWRLVASHTFPYLGILPLRFTVRATLNELLRRRAFTLSRYSVGATLSGDLGPHLRLTGGWELRWRYPFSADPAARLAEADEPDPDWEGSPAAPAVILFRDRPQAGWRRYNVLSLRFGADFRDDLINPTAGVLASLSGEYAPPDPSSEEGFWKAGMQLQYFLPLRRLLSERAPGWPVDLRVRLRSGYGQALGSLDQRRRTLPIEERFWAGGGESMRGYRTDAVGPVVRRDKVLTGPGFTSTSVRVPVGGDAFVMGSLELAMPLDRVPWRFLHPATVTVFADAGLNTLLRPPGLLLEEGSGCGSDFINGASRPGFSVGLGLSYRTPIGPIRLDLGLPLPTLAALSATAAADRRGVPVDSTRVFGIDAGCFDPSTADAWRLHFSVGAL
jgi:outer membrane protein insertion porin family